MALVVLLLAAVAGYSPGGASHSDPRCLAGWACRADPVHSSRAITAGVVAPMFAVVGETIPECAVVQRSEIFIMIEYNMFR